jgi:hypothetical protein
LIVLSFVPSLCVSIFQSAEAVVAISSKAMTMILISQQGGSNGAMHTGGGHFAVNGVAQGD